MKLGMIGYNEGNGHPFSFSAIINGYDKAEFKKIGWPVILNYLNQEKSTRFGLGNAKITHTWMPKADLSQKLVKACRVSTVVRDPHEMVGKVDGVILARDDERSHWKLASPFLKNGIPVFVDKPLTLNPSELKAFLPYLKKGKLMSCSSMRFAKELDGFQKKDFGKLSLVRGITLKDWPKYGIHILEAIHSVLPFRAKSILAHQSSHASFSIETKEGMLVNIDVVPSSKKCFQADFFGNKKIQTIDISDSFTMFRRTLQKFVELVRTGRQTIEPAHTTHLMQILIAGQKALKKAGKVTIP